MGSHTADILSDCEFKVTIFGNQPSSWLRDDQEMLVGDNLMVKGWFI